MKNVGYPILPADAHTYRDKKIAKIITKTMGGDGIIREITDFIV
jgi:3-deoxy-D-manno-octulosonate 8-phosphate phosphatase KdsC-like HAD superfamily phosphatase